ncbi:MAG: YfhO family protein [Eubacterium sp.]|nr:YfhO family protein [Eubacterium sp.]
MDKIKPAVSKRQRYLNLFLTIFIPPAAVAVILLAVFAANGLYPFGEKSLAWCDMRQQVVPLILDFKDILAGKGDFFLNMQNASGMNFYGVFLFFISSPFTLLACLVDKADMMAFMNILTVLKAAVCALTAAVYFRVCHKKLNSFFTVILSVMYAMSGYLMLFYQNTVWLDVMYFFPLLMISFRSLTHRKNNIGLILCLVGMLALNYYLSYMVVLFTILYFGIYLFLKRKSDSTRGVAVRFVIGCFIAALISAVVWLPSFAQYLGSARGADIIQGLANSDIFTEIYTALPLVFCTMFGFAVLILFFARRVTFDSKFYTALLILTLIPVVFEPINKMWHTGDYMSFPVRYGYITVLLMLAVCASKLKLIKCEDFAPGSSMFHIMICFILCGAVGAGSLIYYYYLRESLDAYSTTLHGDMDSFLLLAGASCVFLFMFVYILYAGITGKLSYKPFCAALAIMTVITSVFNANVYISAASYKPATYDQAIVLENKIPQDDDFYRVKNKQSMSKYFDANLLGGLGYNTIAHYTSLTSEDYMFAMKRMGYSSYWMEVTGSGGTLLTDALMSIKYRIEKYSFDKPYVYSDNVYTIRENEFYLPLGIITDSDLSQHTELPDVTRTEIQEYLAETLLGSSEKLFTEYEYSNKQNLSVYYQDGSHILIKDDEQKGAYLNYNIDVKGRQTLYFDCFDLVSRRLVEHINDSFSVYVNGQYTDLNYPSKDSNGMLELGTFEDEKVSITVSVNRSVNCKSFGVFGLSHEALGKAIDNADPATLKVDGREITGHIADAKEGQYLYVSVPYDGGFKAYINGQQTELYRAMTGFMAIKLNEGDNDVRLYFTPQGFNVGLIVTLSGIVLCAVWLILRRRLDKALEKLDSICRVGVYVLTCGVLLAVYVAPTVLNILGMLNII